GRIKALGGRMWYHLFNPEDHVLTAPIKLAATSFQQIVAQFDIPNDVLNHNATWYLGHANTIATVWRALAGGAPSRSLETVSRGFKIAAAKPDQRALLVGINDYPDPANRLEGCVNDVFLMSSLLQESGFKPEEIRVVLDSRATAQGIMDRLHWLLDGVRDGDQRMLFYSGHGAQIPGYGAKGEPDHVDECLVPYDFDWSPQRAILDNQFCELYSQLPYESQFVAVFDCCHSGGLSRDGGPRIRGLAPPDDIRHRALRWEPVEQMWVSRDFPPLNRSLARKSGGDLFLGSGGATHRLGRAAELRTLPDAKYDATRKALDHKGPYLPVLLEACQEQQLSFEYRHGAASYGAYTFCLALALRTSRANGTNPTFAGLNAQVTAKLRRLKFDQTPVIVGAKQQLTRQIPWSAEPAPQKNRRTARSRAR
ncbi:MAG: caspase family protein, partial [Betaproteobacteria bacterium]